MGVTNDQLMTELRLHRALLNSVLSVSEVLVEQGDSMAKTVSELVAELKTRGDALKADNAELKAAVAAAVALIQGASAKVAAMQAQIAELIANTASPSDRDALQQLSDDLGSLDLSNDTDLKVLTDAVKANTTA